MNQTFSGVGPTDPDDLDPVGWGRQWGYYSDQETSKYYADPIKGTPYARAPQVLCGRRYYSPSLGRFLTRDPISYGGGINLYAYCRNNPVMRHDPSGLGALIIWGRNQHATPQDPTAWQRKALLRAKRYETTFVRAPGLVPILTATNQKAHVVQAFTLDQVQKALHTYKNIDTIIYYGHGTTFGVQLGDIDQAITVRNVGTLPTENVLPGAYIELDGCHIGDAPELGQAFADHFNAHVHTYRGPVSFGFPTPFGRIGPDRVRTSFSFGSPSAQDVYFYPHIK